jgi:hypothetical protein
MSQLISVCESLVSRDRSGAFELLIRYSLCLEVYSGKFSSSGPSPFCYGFSSSLERLTNRAVIARSRYKSSYTVYVHLASENEQTVPILTQPSV